MSAVIVRSGVAHGMEVERFQGSVRSLHRRAADTLSILAPQRILHVEGWHGARPVRRRLRRGEICLIQPLVTVDYRFASIDAVLITIPRPLIEAAAQRLAPDAAAALAFRGVPRVSDPLLSLSAVELWDEISPTGETSLYAECLGVAILARVLKRYARRGAETLALGSVSGDVRIRRVLAYVQERLAERLSLSDVAREVGLSAPHLSEVFKAATGESVWSFIRRLRLREAQALLSGTRLSIEEIAERVGYASSPSFTNTFTSVLGTTPGRYRGLHRSELIGSSAAASPPPSPQS